MSKLLGYGEGTINLEYCSDCGKLLKWKLQIACCTVDFKRNTIN